MPPCQTPTSQIPEDAFRLFDWYSQWPMVEAILQQDRVIESLEIVTRHLSVLKGVDWDRDQTPSFYSEPSVEIQKPVDHYRCYGCCYSINTWAGVLGEAIAPELQWQIMIAIDKSHAVAVGNNDNVPMLMMDLVWGPKGETTVEDQVAAAMKIYNDVQAPGSGSVSVCTIANMLDIIKEDTEKRQKKNHVQLDE